MSSATAGDPAHRSQARVRVHELGEVPPAERVRLARFGVVLRAERGVLHWTQADLAARAGVSRLTVARLETATRRPSTTSVWKIAKALRPRGTLHDQVAVDERRRAAAGASLRDYTRRAHAARERVRAELVAEAGSEMPVTEADNFASLIITNLAVPEDC